MNEYQQDETHNQSLSLLILLPLPPPSVGGAATQEPTILITTMGHLLSFLNLIYIKYYI